MPASPYPNLRSHVSQVPVYTNPKRKLFLRLVSHPYLIISPHIRLFFSYTYITIVLASQLYFSYTHISSCLKLTHVVPRTSLYVSPSHLGLSHCHKLSFTDFSCFHTYTYFKTDTSKCLLCSVLPPQNVQDL